MHINLAKSLPRAPWISLQHQLSLFFQCPLCGTSPPSQVGFLTVSTNTQDRTLWACNILVYKIHLFTATNNILNKCSSRKPKCSTTRVRRSYLFHASQHSTSLMFRYTQRTCNAQAHASNIDNLRKTCNAQQTRKTHAITHAITTHRNHTQITHITHRQCNTQTNATQQRNVTPLLILPSSLFPGSSFTTHLF